MTGETIRTIAAAALARFDAVIDWLGIGGGKMRGPEYLALNPLRSDAKPGSFTINRNTGHWADFATGDKGGDLVSLAAYLRSEKQGAAAVALAGFLAIDAGDLQKRPPAPERESSKGQSITRPEKIEQRPGFGERWRYLHHARPRECTRAPRFACAARQTLASLGLPGGRWAGEFLP